MSPSDGDRIDALLLRAAVARREFARDNYRRAAEWHAQTRTWERETSGPVRGAKMSATYQLKAAARRLDALLMERNT